MELTLQRITTEYVETEDRLRVLGEVRGGSPVVLWVSQRMLRLLLPGFFQWLGQPQADEAYAELMQGFAQHAAQAGLAPQPAVRAPSDAPSGLVVAVDVSQSEHLLTLRFRDGGSLAAVLSLDPTQLRQWLGILHILCKKADWPCDLWPAWLADTTLTPQLPQTVLH